eukprot:1959154-Amphidinium_carterae.1
MTSAQEQPLPLARRIFSIRVILHKDTPATIRVPLAILDGLDVLKLRSDDHDCTDCTKLAYDCRVSRDVQVLPLLREHNPNGLSSNFEYVFGGPGADTVALNQAVAR